MFNTTSRNGFQITFANGYTVSVQWHHFAYCKNRRVHRNTDIEHASARACPNAEVAAWDANGKWLRLADHDDVLGHQTPEQVTAILDMVSKL